MRLWSFHPGHLDRAGLVALWREALLAQAVLAGETVGYRSHPQLDRFRAAPDPAEAIGAYLSAVAAEARRRGYRFDATKIRRPSTGRRTRGGPGGLDPRGGRIAVPRGQVEYEWALFKLKAARRDPEALSRIEGLAFPRLHPLFRLAPGGIAGWERPKDLGTLAAPDGDRSVAGR